MNTKKENIEKLCIEAIQKVDDSIELHKNGKSADLDEHMLVQVRAELVKMKDVLDSKRYSPTYGHFLLDWPDEHGLIEYLLNVSYKYKRKV